MPGEDGREGSSSGDSSRIFPIDERISHTQEEREREIRPRGSSAEGERERERENARVDYE